ncbi:class I SAM-dependent methyltransferase [Bradyrhizobium sp. 41S5]|uniref:Eco57I restriction-modification methylase domain-containing protein n=1 Tax=Bradyrhizobium sp. 41S5 TaxID=1404443 RepID=UPI00156AE3E2|nr:class I SAM-dependent methyltransferase [Bradyrhizobium sp. 41S5]UFX46130.1 class I SAM-dependent methyltransferase [Bradyrhizobium sp. 41S5]
MIASESELAALAGALIGKARLPAPERRLVLPSVKVSREELRQVRTLIRAGQDPLGDYFSEVRSSEARREQGQTYTPNAIVDAMVAWAAAEAVGPRRVVDAGAGSGRFLMAAAKAFPGAELIAVEVDPLAALMVRANATVLGFADRLTIESIDYRSLDLPPIDGPTLFIGNPPYVRHHEIGPKWKSWFSNAARELGFEASALAGLHVHFFLRTRQIAKPGDFGAFITAAEWLDVNYGKVLRRMLADGLGGTALHVIDSKALPFNGTMSTGAITCFRVGHRPDQFTVRHVDSIQDLMPLSAGRSVPWSEVAGASRWSILVRNTPHVRHGEIELGELFRVHRGQVTGCNEVWIAGDEAADLPARFLFPSITKARELLAAGENLTTVAGLRKVIDLPVDLDELNSDERRRVDAFLAWAKQAKAHKSYVATHRPAWWSVGLKHPAAILCTYMARRAPAFVRNRAKARHLNISHGLYPVQPLSDGVLDAIAKHLRETVSLASGRVYAGGLVKFEPGEVARLHIPELASLDVQ